MNKTDNLLKERVKLKKEIKHTIIDDDMKDKIEKRIKDIENEIGAYLKNVVFEARNLISESLRARI